MGYVVVLAVLQSYITAWVIFGIIVSVLYGHIQPLKARLRPALLLNMTTIFLHTMALSMPVFMPEDWVCLTRDWVQTISISLLAVSYVSQCFRLFISFKITAEQLKSAKNRIAEPFREDVPLSQAGAEEEQKFLKKRHFLNRRYAMYGFVAAIVFSIISTILTIAFKESTCDSRPIQWLQYFLCVSCCILIGTTGFLFKEVRCSSAALKLASFDCSSIGH
jgi:hypothetical protein